jgi:hypothetical protein
LDDDITQAINSLDSSAANTDPVPVSLDGTQIADSQNMPPIVRPGDDLATLSFESSPVSPEMNMPTDVPDPVVAVPDSVETPLMAEAFPDAITADVPDIAPEIAPEVISEQVVEPVADAISEPQVAAVEEPVVEPLSQTVEAPAIVLPEAEMLPEAPVFAEPPVFEPVAPMEVPLEAVPSEQIYAPLPQLASQETPVPQPAYTPNPAMVADPLYQDAYVPEVQRVAVDGSMNTGTPSDSSATAMKAPVQNSSLVRKIITYSVLAIIGISVVVGGYFGYKAYAEQNNLSILSKAAKAIVTAKGINENIEITSGSTTSKLIYDVDTDNNKRLLAVIGPDKYALIKTKAKDSLYFGSSTSLDPEKIKTFTEYSGLTSTSEFVTSSYLDITKLLDVSAIFTKDSLKFIKSEGSESIDGKSSYKYTFSPSQDMVKAYYEGLSKTTETSAIPTYPESVVITIWIDKTSGNLVKLSGTSKVADTGTAPAASTANILTQGIDSLLNSTFSLTVKYGITETVKLPIGSKITSKIDLKKVYEDNLGAGAESKAKDASLKATVDALKTAITAYLVDTSNYPTATNATELLTLLNAGDNPYLTSDFDVTNIDYTYDPETSKYTISYVLNYQDATGENITGAAPNKTYTVTD